MARGEDLVAAGRQLHITITLAAARGLPWGVAGAEPPHKGGPKARPSRCEERGERSEERESALVGAFGG